MKELAQKENRKRTWCPGNQVKEGGGGKNQLCKRRKRVTDNGKLKVTGHIQDYCFCEMEGQCRQIVEPGFSRGDAVQVSGEMGLDLEGIRG